MRFTELFHHETARAEVLGLAQIVTDPSRCVQCGICNQNCPVGIDIRRHSWLGQPVQDSHCISCGQCVAVCPRRGLRFERLAILEDPFQVRG